MLGRKQRKWNNTSENELKLDGSNRSFGEFEERVQKAICDTLALLGPVGRHKFCLRLKDEFNLELSNLASDPERLSSVLDQTLGPAGQVVGRAIARKIAATYSIDLRQDRAGTYADHVKNLKQMVSRDCTLSKRVSDLHTS